MRMRNYFTLIELLVVVSIIGILSSMLLPALGKARVKAKDTLCTSNLKQHHIAAMLYAEDYDGFLPREAKNQFLYLMNGFDSVEKVPDTPLYQGGYLAKSAAIGLQCPSYTHYKGNAVFPDWQGARYSYQYLGWVPLYYWDCGYPGPSVDAPYTTKDWPTTQWNTISWSRANHKDSSCVNLTDMNTRLPEEYRYPFRVNRVVGNPALYADILTWDNSGWDGGVGFWMGHARSGNVWPNAAPSIGIPGLYSTMKSLCRNQNVLYMDGSVMTKLPKTLPTAPELGGSTTRKDDILLNVGYWPFGTTWYWYY